MRAVPLAVAILAALAAAAPAAAAPPWSEPQTISRPHVFVDGLALGVSGNGSALASWGWQDGLGEDARVGSAAAARPAGAAAFGAEVGLLAPAAGPLLYARDRAVLVRERSTGSPRRPRARLDVAFGRADGAFLRPRTLVERAGVRRPVAAVNARGDLAVAWFEDRGTANDRIVVAVRRAGSSRFGAPVRLAQERIRSVAVAVGERGDVLVAWDARGVVRARVRRPGARAFGPTDTIRSEDAFFAGLRVALGPTGRAYVAWSAQLLTEGGGIGPVYYQAAVRPAGARRFRAAQLLERLDDPLRPGGIDLAIDPASGGAAVAWAGHDGTGYRIRISRTDARAVFAAPQTLPADAGDWTVEDLAAAPSGALMVAALRTVPAPPVAGAEDRGQAVASVAPPGGAFGPPEAVSSDEQVIRARAAFDPVTGRPLAVWINRPAGSRGPLANIRTVVQAAARSAP